METKHPQFDVVWEQHFPMVFHWDHILRKYIYHITGHRCQRGTFLGWLTIRFNHILYNWDHTQSSLFNYFASHIRSTLIRDFMARESESWYRFVRNFQGEQEELTETNRNYAFHESGYYLYRVPDKDLDWAQAIISTFDSYEAAWNYFTSTLQEREKNILIRRFRFGHILAEISRDENVSQERIRQIQDRAIGKIRILLDRYSQYADTMVIDHTVADIKPITRRIKPLPG